MWTSNMNMQFSWNHSSYSAFLLANAESEPTTYRETLQSGFLLFSYPLHKKDGNLIDQSRKDKEGNQKD